MKKRKFATTSLGESYRNVLGITTTTTGKKNKKIKTRKEIRKETRQQKKQKTIQNKVQKNKQNKQELELEEKQRKNQKEKEEQIKKKRKLEKNKIEAPSEILPEDPEDEEIARLEKLLGVNGKGNDKKKAAQKLNKEYEMYEGISGNFGDFLMKLDELTDTIHKGKYTGVFKKQNGSDDEDDENESDFESQNNHHHIIDDSEQEGSDIEYSEQEQDEDEDESEEQEDDEDEDEDNESDYDQNVDQEEEEEEENNNLEDDNDHDEDEDEDEDETIHQQNGSNKKLPANVYQPTPGEDIYGRIISSSQSKESGGKYIPPAKRQQMMNNTSNSNNLAVIDENSETYRMLKRQLNGQLNRLSEQTRDSVLKSIGDLFKGNSFTLLCHIFKQYLFSVCGNPSQLMDSLIPLYASLIAALNFTVHNDIGSYLLEALVLKLIKGIDEDDNSNKSSTSLNQDHALISNKTSTNILLLLVYFYNLRVTHHRLIVDILNYLITPKNSSQDILKILTPLRVELILCVIEHCGTTLRTDDPQELRSFILKLNTLSTEYTNHNNNLTTKSNDSSFDGRLHFMISSLADLKNNKSRRSQSVHAENIVSMKKWIGRTKSTKSDRGAEGCLTMSLQDLLQADTVGRWWKAGASWGGRDLQNKQKQEEQKSLREQSISQTVNEEEKLLLKLATKFRMNTSVKRNIFVVLMSSRDSFDAYERLNRLDIKGKQDREVIRVIATVCGLEKTYNGFYAEVLSIFCRENRQNRTTLQYVFWDFFKVLMNENSETAETHLDRKAINMARLLANMVTQFYLSLSILKVIDMSSLTSSLMLFLATFFLALFSTKISDETFASVLDRVATTADCLLIRENVLFFLQKHLENFPSGLPAEELKLMKKRRKQTIHTLDSMSVLDIAQGLQDQDNEKNDIKDQDFD